MLESQARISLSAEPVEIFTILMYGSIRSCKMRFFSCSMREAIDMTLGKGWNEWLVPFSTRHPGRQPYQKLHDALLNFSSGEAS